MSKNINTGPDRLSFKVSDFGVLRKVCSHALNAKPKTGCHSFKYVFFFFSKCVYLRNINVGFCVSSVVMFKVHMFGIEMRTQKIILNIKLMPVTMPTLAN